MVSPDWWGTTFVPYRYRSPEARNADSLDAVFSVSEPNVMDLKNNQTI